MFTTQSPSFCTQCMSKNISLGDATFKKDVWGNDTEIAVSGTWFCNECGNVLGRKTSQYDNDINEDSI